MGENIKRIMNKEYIGKALCGRQDCVQKDKCVRAKGFLTLEDTDRTFLSVNPKLVTGDENCPMAKVPKPVNMAFGFMELLDRLPSKVARNLSSNFRLVFGKNPYYDRRNGCTPITPEEQETIIQYIAKFNVEVGDAPFDRYEVMEVF